MEGISQALVITVLSRGWVAVISLLAVPLYLRLLGIEAYGVVGLFTSFSTLISFLDLGLGVTLARELARISGNRNKLVESRDQLRTFEIVTCYLALLIGLIVALGSRPVAHYWIQAQNLNSIDIAQALVLAGLALACQWPTNLYNQGLTGLQKQSILGIATMIFATIRVVCTLLIIWVEPNLVSFFLAQIVTSLLQTLSMRWMLWRELGLVEHRPQLRIAIIRSAVNFAGGMTGISITSVILTQTDKIILSKTLNLVDYGYYVVAGTLATGLYVLITPMFSIVFPRFSNLVENNERSKLIDLYHTSSQLIAVLVIPIAVVLAIFSQEILYFWTKDFELSNKTALTLSFLVLGNAINGMMNIPFAVQLAYGWTNLALYLNFAFITILVPTIWWAAKYYGTTGAAGVWLALNILCLLIVPQIMHYFIIQEVKKKWYWNSIIKPLIMVLPIAIIVRYFFDFFKTDYAIAYIILSWFLISNILAMFYFKLKIILNLKLFLLKIRRKFI